MINCTFPYKLESTEEFDRICTMEIMPAILKAYGSIAARHDPMNDALLSAATERALSGVCPICAAAVSRVTATDSPMKGHRSGQTTLSERGMFEILIQKNVLSQSPKT